MDRLKGLDLCCNLARHFTRIVRLLNSGCELRNGSGVSPDDGAEGVKEQSLEYIFEELMRDDCGLYDLLNVKNRPRVEWDDLWAIDDVASSAREDYEKLLESLTVIRHAKPDHHRWMSFKDSLLDRLHASEMDQLESICHDSWAKLTRHFCSLMRCHIRRFQTQLQTLREVNARHINEIPQHFRQQIGLSPQLESLPRLVEDALARVDSVESKGVASVEDVDFCRSKTSHMENMNRQVRLEQTIIRTLAFEGQDVQFRFIPTVTEPMFNWVFTADKSSGSENPCPELSKWLRHGNGAALIKGRSGSGKSLLLKFLATHRELDSTLRQWSNPNPVVVASHFFSALGTPKQRSRQGMLQSLLRTLLLQLPAYIETVSKDCSLGYHSERVQTHRWVVSQLETQILALVTFHTNVKFCLFIDALDECDDDVVAVIRFLESLIRTGNVKLCASSGPNTKAASAFSIHLVEVPIDGDKMQRDIEADLTERLKSSSKWRWDLASHSEVAQLIARRTQNFLCGRLTVEQLLLRSGSRPSLPDIMRAVEDMPSRLEDLLRHCLRASSHQEAQAGAYKFLVARAAKAPPPATVFHFVSEELGDPEYAMKAQLPANPVSDTDELCRHAKSAIGKQCGSFLQVRPDLRVSFVHKAIRDMFDINSIVSGLRAKAWPKHDVTLSLARAYLAYMKSTKLHWGRTATSDVSVQTLAYPTILSEFLEIIREAGAHPKMHELLDDWEAFYALKCQMDQSHIAEGARVSPNASEHFRKPVLDALLTPYVDFKLKKQPHYLQIRRDQDQRFSPPALSLVLESMYTQKPDLAARARHVEMLGCLLRHGYDPNHAYQSGASHFTPWTQFVRQAMTPKEIKWSLRSGLFTLFLGHRADPNSPVWKTRIPSTKPMKRRFYTVSWVWIVSFLCDALRQNIFEFDVGDRHAYLVVLDELLDAGASANKHPSCDSYDNPGICTSFDWAETLMSDVMEGTSALPPDQVLFRTRIVERVLQSLIRSGHAVDWEGPRLRSGLGPYFLQVQTNVSEATQSVREVVEVATSSSSNGSNPASSNLGKRSSDESVTDGEVSSKRARSETDDGATSEPMTISMMIEPSS